MHGIKNGLIIVGMTVLVVGLLGLFGYGPVAAVTGTPLAGATVTLNALTTCTISSCQSLPTLTPATLSGTTTSTGTVTFPAPAYTQGSGTALVNCGAPTATAVSETFSPTYFVSVNGVATGVSFMVGPMTYTCPNSAPTTILGLSTVTAYVGTSYVIINLGTATSTSTTTTSTSTSRTCSALCVSFYRGNTFLATLSTSNNVVNLAPGTYAISLDPINWYSTSLTCTTGSGQFYTCPQFTQPTSAYGAWATQVTFLSLPSGLAGTNTYNFIATSQVGGPSGLSYSLPFTILVCTPAGDGSGCPPIGTTTTTTTTTTAGCTTNCPPNNFILPSIVTLLGAGITVVGITRKESG